jgi:integrase
MEILKRKSGIKYREKITINGVTIKSPVFDRKHDCKQWLAEQKVLKQKHLVHGSEYKLHQKITLEEFSQKWLDSKKAQGIARSSYKNYESYFRIHILKYFQNRNINTLEKSEIEKFQLQLAKEHKPKGANLIVAALRSLLRDAVKDGYILRNPCDHIKTLSADKVHDVFWTKAEIDQFLKANYYHELHDFFLVAINTGMRLGELAGLCWDRVNFADNTIAVTRTRDRYELKQRTKTNIIRILPMNSITRATLLNLAQQNATGSEYVFCNEDGSPIEVHHIYRKFVSAQKKAGFTNTIRFHDLRHTFASQFIMNKGNIYDLQKLLGHTEIAMTTRYAHHSMEHLQSAMSNFNLGTAKEIAQNESAQIRPMKDILKNKTFSFSKENQQVV